MVKAKWIPIKFSVMGLTFFLAVLVFIQCSGPAQEIEAQLDKPEEEMEEITSSFSVELKDNHKIEASLNQLIEAYCQGGLAEAQAFGMSHMMVLQDDRVQVTIVTTEEAIGDVRIAVEAVGGQYQLHHKNLLQALVPIGELQGLAQRPDVLIIREPRRALVP